MNHLAQVPVWAAIIVAVFVSIGAVLTLLGNIGLMRIGNFYDRLHAPTLGTSWGAAGIIVASSLLFTVLGTRLVIHEFVLGVLVTITTPVSMMILARAALQRDRLEGNPPPGSSRPAVNPDEIEPSQ